MRMLKEHILTATFIICYITFSPTISYAASSLSTYGAYQSQQPFAGGVFIEPICDIVYLLNNEMGAFFTTVSLFFGLVVAAIGNFNNIKATIVTGVGGASITSIISLYFGSYVCGQ